MANSRGWRYAENFRRTAVERFKCCENFEWLAKELGVPRQTLFRWHEERGRGMLVNHKRVARLMREDNLVGTEMESSRVSIDAQEHGEIYVNLANRLKLNGVNQLWVSRYHFRSAKARVRLFGGRYR